MIKIAAGSTPVVIKKRHMIIPAVYLILREKGNILFLRRFNTGYEDGNYSLPAGHVEEGETFTEALIREVTEEISIMLSEENVRVAHIMHRKNIQDGSERVDTFFVADAWEGEVQNKEPYKCDDLSWFRQETLPENTIPYIREALTAIQNNVFYSEFGWEEKQS